MPIVAGISRGSLSCSLEERISRPSQPFEVANRSCLSTRAELRFCSRDDFPWVRLCRKISRRRRKFFRAAAMDARSAAIEAGCYLARAVAGDRLPAVRPCQNQQLLAVTAYPWIGRSLFFALSESDS